MDEYTDADSIRFVRDGPQTIGGWMNGEAPMDTTENSWAKRLNDLVEATEDTMSVIWNDDDEIARASREGALSAALKIAGSLPQRRDLADETLAFVKELLDWRDGRQLPNPCAAETD